jgi:hypothetical protein
MQTDVCLKHTYKLNTQLAAITQANHQTDQSCKVMCSNLQTEIRDLNERVNKVKEALVISVMMYK